MRRGLDLFTFSSQTIQVFFSNDVKKRGWQIVLHKEACARREFVDTSDLFVSTIVRNCGLTAPEDVPPLLIVPCLVGAKELSVENSLLAST